MPGCAVHAVSVLKFTPPGRHVAPVVPAVGCSHRRHGMGFLPRDLWSARLCVRESVFARRPRLVQSEGRLVDNFRAEMGG